MDQNLLFELMPSLKGRLIFFEQISSTNDPAKELARKGTGIGKVIIATEQTAGRGRQGRYFHSPKGCGIYITIIVPSPMSANTPVTALAACAVCKALEDCCGRDFAIKWVNDVLLDEYKVCGILAESVGTAIVIGTGINVNTPRESFLPDLPHASSLAAQFGHSFELEKIVVSLVKQFDLIAMQLDNPAFVARELDYYRSRLITLGRQIKVITSDSERVGIAIGLDSDAALLVDFGQGEERVIFGDVSVRGINGYL